MEPVFITVEDVIAIHSGLADGVQGPPSMSLLESAVNAAQWDYCMLGRTDVFDLAASYLFHICQDHCFVDGNKRTASGAALVFLYGNGYEHVAECVNEQEYQLLVLEVASGGVSKAEIARFFRSRCRRRPYRWGRMVNPGQTTIDEMLGS